MKNYRGLIVARQIGFLLVLFCISHANAQRDPQCVAECTMNVVGVNHIEPSPYSLNGTSNSITNFRDDLSISDVFGIERGEKWLADSQTCSSDPEKQLSICYSRNAAVYRKQIPDSIRRILEFYSSHQDLLTSETAHAIRLSLLKGVDNKHGKMFQNSYDISAWIKENCDQLTSRQSDFCTTITSAWRYREGHNWKPEDAIQISAQTETLNAVGYERESMWNPLNSHCQLALVERCEIPLICEVTLYDPVPESQQFLVNQLFLRILTEQSGCSQAKQILSEDVNDRICSKMYQEAQLIARMGYPDSLRDVFIQYVAYCGFMGYPNFFREDWIDSVLFWQSSSEFGCFTHGENFQSKLWTNDTPIVRRKTIEEKQTGLEHGEECLPRLTTAALSALAITWDYMEENCLKT